MRSSLPSLRTLAALASLLLTALLGAACSPTDVVEGIANDALEDQGVSVDLDGDQVSIEGPDGQTITAGAGLPEDFPDDFPLPDDAEALGGVSGIDAQHDIVASFSVQQSVEDLTAFYATELPAAGYTVTEELSGPDRTNTVFTIEGNGHAGQVIINPAGPTSQLAVTLDIMQ